MAKGYPPNPYAGAPFAMYPLRDGVRGPPVVFLGDVPGRVLEAARRGERGRWAAKDAKILESHYGARWKAALHASRRGGRDNSDPVGIVGGGRDDSGPVGVVGGDFDFGDLGDFDAGPGEDADAEPAPAEAAADRRVYSDLRVYPEDTADDLRLKVAAALGVPAFRIHAASAAGPGYRLLVDGDEVPVDYPGPAAELPRVAGIAIDAALERGRDGLLYEERPDVVEGGEGFYVDIAWALAAPAVRRIRDDFQRDLLYYGHCAKYWPRVPRATFVQLMAGEPGDPPDGDPGPRRLRARMRAEREVSDLAYAYRGRGDPATMAVTEMRLEFGGAPVTANLRNIFDGLRVGARVPLVAGRVRLGRRPFSLEKRHASAFAARAAALARVRPTPGKEELVFAVTERAAGRAARAGAPLRYWAVRVRGDGAYSAEGSWREDEKVDFARARKALAGAAEEVARAIEALGAPALPFGERLARAPPAVGRLAASVAWPAALSSAGFQRLRAELRVLEDAGVAAPLTLQTAGAHAFRFLKGFARDGAVPPGAARDEEGSRGGAQRGRPEFRVVHRSADVRLAIEGPSLAAFELVRRYIFALFDRHAAPRKGAAGAPPREAGRLRGLREQDPQLYDLKRFDPGATVYSILCQGDRQPEIVAKGAPGAARYWNFTEGRPEFYRCPSKKYPHLSFRAGEHPLGYCLPCCKKTRPQPGSKAAKANELCAKSHALAPEQELEIEAQSEDPLQLLRHVLSYRKAVPVGRISYPPTAVCEELLFDTAPPPIVYRLAGVAQSVPSLPDAGLFYSLAAVLEMPAREFAEAIAETAQAFRETFFALGRGAGALVGADGFAGAVRAAFVDEEEGLSPLGPGGAIEDSWEDILADLYRMRYDIEVVEVVDGGGALRLQMSPAAAARLRQSEVSAVDLAVVVRHEKGTYPLFAMDPAIYLRVEGGAGPARRFFASDYGDEELVPDTVVEALAARLGDRPGAGGAAPFRLADAQAFAAGRGVAAKYAVEARLVGARDFCHGLLLRARGAGRADEHVYIPVHPSAHFPPRSELPGPAGPAGPLAEIREGVPHEAPEGVELAAEGRYQAPVPALYSPLTPDIRLPAGRLADLHGRLAREFPELRPLRVQVLRGRAVGFVARNGLVFRHDPADPAGVPWKDAEVEELHHDPKDVAAALYGLHGTPGPPLPGPKRALAAAGEYRARAYALLVAEYAAAVGDERDRGLRARIAKEVRRAPRPRDVADAARRVAAAAPALSPDDRAALRAALARAYAGGASPEAALRRFAAALEGGFFDFDAKTGARLAALDAEGRKAELRRLLRRVKTTAEFGPRGERAPAPPNIFTAGDLELPAALFEEFLDVLAADVANPLKRRRLRARGGVYDARVFSSAPGERLRVAELERL